MDRRPWNPVRDARIAEALARGDTEGAKKAFLGEESTSDPTTACALLGLANDPRHAWCGRLIPGSEWAFTDASHALLNERAEGRLTLCPKCASAMKKTIR